MKSLIIGIMVAVSACCLEGPGSAEGTLSRR